MPRSRASALGSLRTLTGASMTFSRAVMWANRLKRWKTMPIELRCRAISANFRVYNRRPFSR